MYRSYITSLAITLSVFVSICQAGGSAIQFFDSTGATPTTKFGWTGDPVNGNFFIETPNSGTGITAKNGNMTVDGKITADSLKGVGSEITDLNGQNLAPRSVSAAKIDSVNWDRISGMPAGFADGQDNAGTGSGVSLPLNITDITGLQSAIDAKAALSHLHVITGITGLQDSLNAKSSTTHIHAISNITGLQTALDAKSALSHAHIIGNTTGLQTALDAKAALSHLHLAANITGLQDSLNKKINLAGGTFTGGVTFSSGSASNPISLSNTGSTLVVPFSSATGNFTYLCNAGNGSATDVRFLFSHGTASQLNNRTKAVKLFIVGPALHNAQSDWGEHLMLAHDGNNGTVRSNYGDLLLESASGVIKANNSVIATTSDIRLKKDIHPLTNSLDAVNKMNGVSFVMKNDKAERRNVGLIAQDVEKIIPDVVFTDNQGYKSIAYSNLVAVLIEAIKEQQKQLEQMKSVLEYQSSEITELKTTLSPKGR